MSVMWSYLDKEQAVIKVLEDYGNMRFIIENTDEQIKLEEERMTGLGSPDLDGMPHAHNPQAGEDRILDGMEKIDIIKERYRQAVEYMNWFVPAWNKLDEDDRFTLDAFFGENGYGAGAADVVCDHFGIERNSAYRKRKRALDRLKLLLYGKI